MIPNCVAACAAAFRSFCDRPEGGAQLIFCPVRFVNCLTCAWGRCISVIRESGVDVTGESTLSDVIHFTWTKLMLMKLLARPLKDFSP